MDPVSMLHCSPEKVARYYGVPLSQVVSWHKQSLIEMKKQLLKKPVPEKETTAKFVRQLKPVIQAR